MDMQKLVTTTMVDQYDQLVSIRQCSEPTEKVIKIYDSLNYKHQPYTRKKSVVPLPENKKIKPLILGLLVQHRLQCMLKENPARHILTHIQADLLKCF